MLTDEVIRRDPNQAEYVQAVQNFVNSVVPVFERYPKYAWVMKTLMEPERVIQFRVPWIDDEGSSRVNRGFRVQFSSSLGPYMGGLRFHPETTHGIAKFLSFETIFRNALAGPYGGAHGGSDFNPMDKSESEIMRFCQSYMTELANYIGPHTDVPTSGVGVGPQEIGYMFGQYKRLRQLHPGGTEGILSGGAYHYPQVTGYGVAHFANRILESRGETLKGKRCLISGSGTVALNVAQKLLDLGAIPIGMSDNFGYLVEEEGFTDKGLAELKRIKEERNARLGAFIMSSTTVTYHPSDEEGRLWDTPCDYAFPCAIQNDIDADAVRVLVKNGCKGIFEGANFPCTDEAISLIKQHGIAFGPNKASNGGSFALITKNLGASTQLSDDELDKIVKGTLPRLLTLNTSSWVLLWVLFFRVCWQKALWEGQLLGTQSQVKDADRVLAKRKLGAVVPTAGSEAAKNQPPDADDGKPGNNWFRTFLKRVQAPVFAASVQRDVQLPPAYQTNRRGERNDPSINGFERLSWLMAFTNSLKACSAACLLILSIHGWAER
ncbi:unnamed protein product [Phytophthora fragariaefolia]|uniref:Unnamed protein product n=1 Tax=Phytophthora fragariaefolia TaxID=1490495 RepID=A0A9W6XVW1_9STRA|nr:unnamed protein product [Phytophthora fragariaefolia]